MNVARRGAWHQSGAGSNPAALASDGRNMTPRERVLTALEHRAPDRTPRDFWAEEPAWNRLLEHFGHNDRERVLVDLGIDVRHLEIAAPPELALDSGLYQNFWGERYNYRQTPWGPLREDVRGALAGSRNFADLTRFHWPSPDQFDHAPLAQQCRRWEAYALLYGFADIWQRPALVRGWEEMFVDMVERPDWVHYLCRRFTDFYKEDYTRAAEATQGRIDLYLLISDLGSQGRSLVSLAMFREFVAPYIKEMADCIHGLGGKVVYHSCGFVRPFISELIGLGVDVLDPIQPVRSEMTPERLKADFGGQLCFHGGIDMQHLLPNGTPGQIRAETLRYCDTLGRNGGYILAPAHLFQPDVPPENILAVYL
jgi:uroporphyrinogen decarboxylase